MRNHLTPPPRAKHRRHVNERLQRDFVARSVMLLAGLAALYFLLQRHGEWFDTAGQWLADHVGLGGVFLFVFVVDTFIVPATLDLIFPLTRGWHALSLVTTISVATVLGGIGGYAIGRFLSNHGFFARATATFRDRGGDALIRRWGFWAVLAAALTPLPFFTVSWTAGALRLDARWYVAAALFRVPRVVAAYWLFNHGFELV